MQPKDKKREEIIQEILLRAEQARNQRKDPFFEQICKMLEKPDE